jgi:two-component system response regulator AtoC
MNCSTELYQLFFNAAREAIFIVDAASQTVLAANAQAGQWTGYRLDELQGQRIKLFLLGQDGSELLSLAARGNDARELHWHEALLRRKSGELMVVNLSVTAIELNLKQFLFINLHPRQAAPGESHAVVPSTILPEQTEFPTIIGQSEKIRHVSRLIGSVAKSEVTVLIQGESGTGKEVVANAIHAHSLRNKGPFVKVNCAALTETLLESELFGHVKGAFTGAIRDYRGRFKQADGGTILLDEIGSLSLSGQVKLLRVLQEHEFEPVGSSVTTPVNVRVIASTNANFEKAVSEGKFREDLFYRLNVFSIALPPLRERKEDIPLLAQHFLNKYSQEVGKKIRTLAPETLASLMVHDWPGNVRELENAIEHAVIVEKNPAVLPSSLPMNLTKPHTAKVNSDLSIELGLRDKLNLLERQIILDTLMRANWIKKRAADMLRIDARNMPYLLRKHNLSESHRPN